MIECACRGVGGGERRCLTYLRQEAISRRLRGFLKPRREVVLNHHTHLCLVLLRP
jgi:hypothetical protein